MNPDQNQPPVPTPEPLPTPLSPPVPPTTPFVVTPVPIQNPNPFGGAPVSSDPAPQVAPLAPVAPVVPLAPPTPPSVPPTGTTSSSSGSNPIIGLLGDPKKKKFLVLIASIVGAIVVLGIIGFIVIGLFLPSKANYRDAATQFDAVSLAYSDLSLNASKLQYDVGGSTTDTVFTNDSDSVKKSLQTFEDANKKLAGMKAIKFGDGQKLYTTYQGKVSAFSSYATDLLTSLKSFRPVATACNTVTTVTLLSSCVSALNDIGDVPNADLKQFATSLQAQYKAYLDVETKVAAITDPYGNQYDQFKALRDQSYAIQDKISAASSDFTSNASKHASDIDPATAANALAAYLAKNE